MVYRRSASSLSTRSWSSKSSIRKKPSRRVARRDRSRSTPKRVLRAKPPALIPSRRPKPPIKRLPLKKRNTAIFKVKFNNMSRPNQVIVNRSTTCPFLLRVYYKLATHHSLEKFNRYFFEETLNQMKEKDAFSGNSSDKGDNLSSCELQLYTWKDTSLREIVDLVKDLCSQAWLRNSKFSLKLIHLDDAQKNVTEMDLGTLHNSRPGPEDRTTLARYKFQIGDVLSIAILPANPRPFVKKNFALKKNLANQKDVNPQQEEPEISNNAETHHNVEISNISADNDAMEIDENQV